MPKSALFCVAVLLSLQASRSLAQTAPATSTSPTDRGTTIGTTIRAALNAAFPGAAVLADSLINAAATKVKLKENEKAAAKAAATEAAKKTEDQAIKASQEKLRSLDELAHQLDVVIGFADASATANEYIIPMILYMKGHSNITEAEWTANVKAPWDIIYKNLDPLKAYTSQVLNAEVHDIYVKDLLRQIVQAQNTRVIELNSLIKDKPQVENIPRIQQRLEELQPILSNIGRVATLQVQTLSSDLHDAAKGHAQSVGGDTERARRFHSIAGSLEKVKN